MLRFDSKKGTLRVPLLIKNQSIYSGYRHDFAHRFKRQTGLRKVRQLDCSLRKLSDMQGVPAGALLNLFATTEAIRHDDRFGRCVAH